MFRYADTGKLSQSGESQKLVATKIRRVAYINDSPNPTVAEPVYSYGSEIVEEAAVSPEYFNSPEVVIGTKTIDQRNPNRVVERSITKKVKED
jgi:hypothetical protein